MDKSERLDNLRVVLGFKTKKDFAKALGISEQTLSNWYSRNTFNGDLILRKFTNVNESWLLAGKGNMMKDMIQNNSGGDNIVAGDNMKMNKTENCREYLQIISSLTAQLGRSQEQISKLIDMLDRKG